MKKVIAVTANDDFSLDLKFNDGSAKRFDARPYLDYDAFRELKDPEYFKQVRLAPMAESAGYQSRDSVS